MDGLFEINMALRCRVRNLENKIEEFKSGARYLKLQKDHHRVVAGYIKEINRLRKELADLSYILMLLDLNLNFTLQPTGRSL